MPEPISTETQVRAWLAAGETDQLVSFVLALKDQRDRAELLAAAYLHQVKEVSKRANTIIEPMLNPKPRETKPTEQPTKPKLKPNVQKSKGPALDLDIRL